MSCGGAATTSVASVVSGEGVDGFVLAGAVAPADGVAVGAAAVAAVDGAVADAAAFGAAERAVAGGVVAGREVVPRVAVGAVPPVVPPVLRGAEVVRRGALVGFGAAVVGFGAAVVGLGAAVVGAGAEAVAGATLGRDPLPNRKPTDDPGLGSQPLMPIWL